MLISDNQNRQEKKKKHFEIVWCFTGTESGSITQNGAEFKGQTENKKKKKRAATTIVLGYGVHFKVIEMWWTLQLQFYFSGEKNAPVQLYMSGHVENIYFFFLSNFLLKFVCVQRLTLVTCQKVIIIICTERSFYFGISSFFFCFYVFDFVTDRQDKQLHLQDRRWWAQGEKCRGL